MTLLLSCSATIKRNIVYFWPCLIDNREQIPTEYNEEQTQRTLRKQDNVQGEQRGTTISDFPQAAALGKVLKDLDFPADKNTIVRFVEQSNRPDGREVFPLIQKIGERQYENVSKVAEAARLVQ